MNLLELRGPEFLGVYLLLMIVAAGLATLMRYWLRGPGDWWQRLPNLDPYEVAYLAGGKDAVVHAATASLVRRGVLEATGITRRLQRIGEIQPGAHAVETAVLEGMGYGVSATIETICNSARLPRMQARLEAMELVLRPQQQLLVTLGSVAPVGVLLTLGLVKVGVGVSRDRPVGLLVMLCVGMLMGGVWLLVNQPLRTRRGDKVLRQYRESSVALGTTCRLGSAMLSPHDVALAMALFGWTAFADGPLAELAQVLKPVERQRGSGSSGCSSSGCGSSGCSGGCGGGCGGCGS